MRRDEILSVAMCSGSQGLDTKMVKIDVNPKSQRRIVAMLGHKLCNSPTEANNTVPERHTTGNQERFHHRKQHRES